MLYNLYKILFEGEEFQFHFKDKWIPTHKDWEHMILLLDKHSSLDKIFKKLFLDIDNADKVVRYYLIAKALNWPNLDEYLSKTLHDRFRKMGLFYDEIKIVENENILIPEIWQTLIDDLEESNVMGGISLRNQDLGDFGDDSDLFYALSKIEGISKIEFNRVYRDTGNYYKNVRYLKIYFNNGCIAFVKLIRESMNKHYAKCTDSLSRENLDRYGLQSYLEINLAPYQDGLISDNEDMLLLL